MNIEIRKGNLYNQFVGKIDRKLLDSNQYDLEVIVDGEPKYYRIRFIDSKFKACPIKLEKDKFYLPEFSKKCNIYELNSFRKTDFYRKDFPYKRVLEQQKKRNFNSKNTFMEYYYYFQDITKKNIITSELEYSFSIPIINERYIENSFYDVSIERVRNYYYLIFFLNKIISTIYHI